MTAATSHSVAFVGAGIMGRRMAAAVQRHPRFHVSAAWDPDVEAARRLAADFGPARCAGGLQELAGLEGVALVCIASPPAFHLQGVQAALAAGRACLCEKPLAHTVADAQALRDAVAAAGLPFAVHFPFASGAASRRLMALVEGGDLGPVQEAQLTVRFAQWPRPWQAAASDWLDGPVQGGFTREVLSHFVFLAQRLFGPAQVRDVVLERAAGATETRLQATLVRAAAEAGEAYARAAASRVLAHQAAWQANEADVERLGQQPLRAAPTRPSPEWENIGCNPDCRARWQAYAAQMLPLLIERDTQILRLRAQALQRQRAAVATELKLAEQHLQATQYGQLSASTVHQNRLIGYDAAAVGEVLLLIDRTVDTAARAAVVSHCGA